MPSAPAVQAASSLAVPADHPVARQIAARGHGDLLALERTEEWLVLLKLPADRYDELAAFIPERHSYDEPEIIALPIVTGSAAYLSWLREETRPVDPAVDPAQGA